MNPPGATRPAETAADRLRVMVVDDSAVVRGLVTRMLEADPEVAVVASIANGAAALAALPRVEPDVVVLDIEMPVMDGLTALPKLIAASPGLQVLMSSTLTEHNAEISMNALAAGATDYVTKPSAQIMSAEAFKRDLLDKVKTLGWNARRRAPGRRRPAPAAAAPVAQRAAVARPSEPLVLRPARRAQPSALQVIAIGSSTGGPQALLSVLKGIGPALTVPILITQHMPPTFTTIMAQHLAKASGAAAAEARDGEIVQPRRIYVAPGDYHMTIAEEGPAKLIRLNQAATENFCRPAVDPMLRSVAKAYGGHVLAVILTGMGQDGAKGSVAVANAGGTVIAQDEPTSVVWGMPGAAAQAGACEAVLPLTEIGSYLRRAMGGQP
jgi:two-component system chemotaxis response regulator CheB